MAPNCARKFASVSRPSAIDGVYLCRKPLVGWERLAKIAPRPLSLHTMVALRTADEVWTYDFLPVDPTDPDVALRLLTFGAVPGVIRVVQSRSFLGRFREYVGPVACKDIHDTVAQFNATWNTELRLCLNDCRSYSGALSLHLTQPPAGTVSS